jgi:hypothetical protein
MLRSVALPLKRSFAAVALALMREVVRRSVLPALVLRVRDAGFFAVALALFADDFFWVAALLAAVAAAGASSAA